MIDKLKTIFSGRYLRNVGWLGGAELFNRVFRLGTTVTLARVFNTEDYGLMAFIYTVFELANVFTFKHGISAKIIQTNEEHLTTICNTSYWLNWLLCIGVFFLQTITAFPIAYLYDNTKIVFPLCVSALIYLFFPFYMINSAIIERENRLEITAIANAIQSFVSNLVTIILALLGMGIWSIVWSMIISTPVWILVTWKNTSWRPPIKFNLDRWREIFDYGKNLLGLQILNKLTMNIDYLIVGKFLGVEALGLYFFAFNAGSGIITNVVYVFTSALFPHLCAVREDLVKLRKQYYSSLKSMSATIIPLVIVQCLLAPFYVPIIFGEKWNSAVPILIMICLSVIPKTFFWSTNMLLNSIDKTKTSLYLGMIFTVIFTLAILIAVNWGIYWVAGAVLLSHLVFLPAFSIWGGQQVFSKGLRPSS
jgi:O-antigen/teichoic acid export membrane protein